MSEFVETFNNSRQNLQCCGSWCQHTQNTKTHMICNKIENRKGKGKGKVQE